jgi:hypothetical protein
MATRKPVVDETVCRTCHSQQMWEQCTNCEDGYSDHDCGEDTCCCLNPWPNMRCDICDGRQGWYRCYTCAPESI